jgi:hypothetical protein
MLILVNFVRTWSSFGGKPQARDAQAYVGAVPGAIAAVRARAG